jgi:hypothetical protein
MANSTSVYNLPTKQACAFEDNTKGQSRLGPTTTVREPPMTSRASTHNETAKKRASQLFRLQTEKDIALECSTIRCARDDDGCGSHRVPAWNNGDGS